MSRIPEILAALPKEVAAATMAGAELIATSARIRVPVQTGRLRDAIHTEIAVEDGVEHGVWVLAGNRKVFYGRFVEHGHTGGRVPPHPFLVPALEENRDRIVTMIAAGVRGATMRGSL